MTLPITVSKLSLVYNPGEDRIALGVRDADGERVILLLTRRMTGRLINGLGAILKRSSPTVTSAPEELRNDVILMEHQQALQEEQERQAKPRTSAEPSDDDTAEAHESQPQIALVSDIDVSTHRTHFELKFRAGERPLAIAEISRRAMHLFVDALTKRAQEADWTLSYSEDWLAEDQSSWVLN
ncbi:hypothetical protein GCM10007989_30970 [Devosia pacifica]|uniref:Uncharacterized protein n=1 Tax=Devosia pacifica TaxID=1335967 RepID=A0A918VXU6_9HYPH|nr:hypothetical protein [Devosia pacifica]GHA32654.1 hypothetical protein GCM10007989_30970 [Devosia pacifica]